MRANPDFPVNELDWAKIKFRIAGNPGPDDCWIWTGPVTTPNKTSTGGYGQTSRIDGKRRLAHRASWLYHHGTLGADMTIDHMCHTDDCIDPCIHRRCINPAHMKPASLADNARRSSYFNPNKEFCIRGHVMDGRRSTTGEQYCRTCIRESTQRWRERKKGA